MNQSIKIFSIIGIVLMIEIIVFREHIAPILWGKFKISGLACTCPDETVKKGRLYLRHITPDTLKKYDLNYSEIYVNEKPSSNLDPMGSDHYICYGTVIGKDRVSDVDPWNPIVRIDKWRPINMISDLIIKVIFIGQLLIFGWIILKIRDKNVAQQQV